MIGNLFRRGETQLRTKDRDHVPAVPLLPKSHYPQRNAAKLVGTRVATKAFEGHIADALPIAIYPRLFEYPKGRRRYPWLLVFSCLADPARIRPAALFTSVKDLARKLMRYFRNYKNVGHRIAPAAILASDLVH